MLPFLLATLAFANPPVAEATPPAEPAPPPSGELVVEAKVPAELQIDGLTIGQLFVASRLNVAVAAGERKLGVVREGRPEELMIDVPIGGSTVVVVGKTGTTIGSPSDLEPPPVADGPVKLEVRVSGDATMQLRLGRSRFDLTPGQVLSLELPRGAHPISVRSDDGTVIWAAGTLELRGGEISVLQLAEGRMPEVTGGARLLAHKN